MSKQIVCNSGPIIALGILNRLDLLKHLFGETFVPEAVYREIQPGGARGLGLADFMAADWIQVVSGQGDADPLLQTVLDVGELP